MSPVTGWLTAQAAAAGGRSQAAFQGLEEARDAVYGLFGAHAPRITDGLREALIAGSARRCFHCVDLADLCRLDPDALLPDPDYFLDYCHLSSQGIPALAAAVADVVLGREPGTTKPADTLPVADRAAGDILAAVHNSYYGQEYARVSKLVERAVAAHDEGRAFAEALLTVLESTGPVWVCEAIGSLTRYPHAARYLAPMLSRSAELLGMWTLHAALLSAVGTRTARKPDAKNIDLLLTVEQGFIDGAFRTVNHQLPERAYFQAFGPHSHFGFRLSGECDGRVELTYRLPAAIALDATVTLQVNGCPVGELASVPVWTTSELQIPQGLLHEGVNTLAMCWPSGGADWSSRQAADAQALSRGDYPLVLGVQGELYDLRLELNGT